HIRDASDTRFWFHSEYYLLIITAKEKFMKIILKQLLPVAMLAVLFSSCKKDLLDINVDPNNPTTTSASPDLVLPAALNNMAAISNNSTSDNRFAFAGLWPGHISDSANCAIGTEPVSYAIRSNLRARRLGSLRDSLQALACVEEQGVHVG